mgnify:CR=1 FL=1
MSQHAELLFETDRVRSVNDLHVGGHRDNDPSITLAPSTATVSVGGGHAQMGGAITVRDQSGATRATVSEKNGAGTLRVTTRDGQGGVTLSGAGADSPLRVFSDDDTTVAVQNGAAGGRAAVFGVTLPVEPVVTAAARSGGQFTGIGGEVTVRNTDGLRTGVLDGVDGALVLRGGMESPPDDSTPAAAYGGGEVVIGDAGSPNDIHIHATAERDSDYGVADGGNRPMIFLDGPDGTVELGRQERGTDRDGENGTVRIRDDEGVDVLEFRATGAGDSEVTFWMNAGGTQRKRGTIEAHADGLLVTVNHPSTNQPYNTLLITKQGRIETKKPIQENVSL